MVIELSSILVLDFIGLNFMSCTFLKSWGRRIKALLVEGTRVAWPGLLWKAAGRPYSCSPMESSEMFLGTAWLWKA